MRLRAAALVLVLAVLINAVTTRVDALFTVSATLNRTELHDLKVDSCGFAANVTGDAFVFFAGTTNPAFAVKIHAATMAQVGANVSLPGVAGTRTAVVSADGATGFFFSWETPLVLAVDLATMTNVSSLDLDPLDTSVQACVSDGVRFWWCATQTNPSVIIKGGLRPLVRLGAVTVAGTQNTVSMAAQDAGFAFFANQASPGHVFRVRKDAADPPDASSVSELLTLAAGEGGANAIAAARNATTGTTVCYVAGATTLVRVACGGAVMTRLGMVDINFWRMTYDANSDALYGTTFRVEYLYRYQVEVEQFDEPQVFLNTGEGSGLPVVARPGLLVVATGGQFGGAAANAIPIDIPRFKTTRVSPATTTEATTTEASTTATTTSSTRPATTTTPATTSTTPALTSTSARATTTTSRALSSTVVTTMATALDNRAINDHDHDDRHDAFDDDDDDAVVDHFTGGERSNDDYGGSHVDVARRRSAHRYRRTHAHAHAPAARATAVGGAGRCAGDGGRDHCGSVRRWSGGARRGAVARDGRLARARRRGLHKWRRRRWRRRSRRRGRRGTA
jgi:hypothetical protein